ncbi:HEAT repeat domain-containing protein [bacterium]|nr:HEAT repeat domain-containing protein [bacterium]
MSGAGKHSFYRLLGELFLLVLFTAACAPNVKRLHRRENVEGLIEALDYENDSAVRADAALALGEIGDESSIPFLLEALKDDDSDVRSAAEMALASFEEEAVYYLIHALGIVSDSGKAPIVDTLVTIGMPAVPDLIKALSDLQVDVQEGAYQALVRIGAPSAPLLIESLFSSQVVSDQTITEILVEMGSDSVDALIATLDGKGDVDAEFVMELLIEIGEPAVASLIEALSDPDLKIPASDTLIMMGNQAINPLLEYYDANPESREDLLPIIAYGLTFQNDEIAESVADVLVEEGDKAVTAILDMYRNSRKITAGDKIYDAHHVAKSAIGSIMGQLVNGGICDEPGVWIGKVVICAREEDSIYEKALNVMEGGGLGLILYNNTDGYLHASGEGDESVDIIALTLTKVQGEELIRDTLGDKVVLTNRDVSNVADVLVEIGKPVIPQMVDLIGNVQMTSLAQDVLIEIGSPSVQPLIDLFEDSKNAYEKTQIIYIMGQIEDDRFLPHLITTLGNTDESVQSAAEEVLISLGLPAVDPLMTVYHSESSSQKDQVASVLYEIFKDNSDQIEDLAAEICEGQAFEDAAKYNRYESETHPTFVVSSKGETHVWNNQLPADWLVFYPEQMELVLCMGAEEKKVVQICQYYYSGSGATAPNITRYRFEETLELFRAQSGVRLGSTTLRGDNPGYCPYQTSSSMTSIYGDHVTLDQYTDWLSLYGIPFGK